MEEKYGFQKMKKYCDARICLKVKCKCSHVIEIPVQVDKTVCNYCMRTVYRTPEIEFKEKLKKRLGI